MSNKGKYLTSWKSEEDAVIIQAIKENPNKPLSHICRQAGKLLDNRTYNAVMMRLYQLGENNFLEGLLEDNFKPIREKKALKTKKKDTLRILEAKNKNGTLDKGELEKLEALRKELHPVASTKDKHQDNSHHNEPANNNVGEVNSDEPKWRDSMRKVGLLDATEIINPSEQQSIIFEGTLPIGGIPIKAKFRIAGNFTIEILY